MPRASSPLDLLRFAVLPVVFGLLSGIVGALFADAWIAAESYSEPPLLQLGRPRAALTAPLPEAAVAERLSALDVPLYAAKAARSNDLADRARAPSEIVGYAVALTSDGWLATHESVLAAGPVAAGVSGRILEPRQRIADARTGLVFLKIDAAALPVSAFEETEALEVGTPLYASDASGAFSPTVFSGWVPSEARLAVVRDSDRFNRQARLGRSFVRGAAGGAVVTAGGNLAGVLVPAAAQGDRAAFVPTHLFRPILNQVFRNQPIVRASFGVRYLDIESHAYVGAPPSSPSGAALAGSRREGFAAIRAGSAGDEAGLREGDILLRFDGVELSAGRDLAELLGEYAPGARVDVEFLRGEERGSAAVVLK